MKATVVVITRDRPWKVKRLIESVFGPELPCLSLVLIDDSTSENFKKIERSLAPYADVCQHRSSTEVKSHIENVLKQTGLTPTQKSCLKVCVGLKSPFHKFARSLSRINLFRDQFLALLSQSFAPYSTARNLGIYSAHREFNAQRIVFLDDDCYIRRPERLMDALQLVGERMEGKEIVAVSGLYQDLSLYNGDRTHRYQKPTPTAILTGMKTFLKCSFLTQQEQRLAIMPSHILGGALILSDKVFLRLPFDPFIPRGEDHAYLIDFKARFTRDFTMVRDNLFVVQHDPPSIKPRRLQEKNILRDIFRFIYLRFKVDQCPIPFFTTRWALKSLVGMFLEPSNSECRLLQLWALLFLARLYAKRNAHKYSNIVVAWRFFLEQLGTD
ncbi:hypothetical protein GWN63_00875 [Candidatus Bathyarchaeota archaeon]|nr:hypothetical protein [Candidatus Bathyarchaeota archaeon]NIU80790.1 hypothetical protein [Candidatus Bathyarchaeota archaeon]NIV67415.1 hypothetical protein [Candidatus Bathyarchaeota archaeon]